MAPPPSLAGESPAVKLVMICGRGGEGGEMRWVLNAACWAHQAPTPPTVAGPPPARLTTVAGPPALHHQPPPPRPRPRHMHPITPARLTTVAGPMACSCCMAASASAWVTMSRPVSSWASN